MRDVLRIVLATVIVVACAGSADAGHRKHAHSAPAKSHWVAIPAARAMAGPGEFARTVSAGIVAAGISPEQRGDTFLARFEAAHEALFPQGLVEGLERQALILRIIRTITGE